MNHRIQLAVSKAFGSVRAIDSVDELLTALWKYYYYSTIKAGSLDAIQDLMRELGDLDKKQNLTVKKAVHTRWLSHENAIQSIRKLNEAVYAWTWKIPSHLAGTRRWVIMPGLLRECC
ncbi:hypothetical protein DPMN_097994 [Dreissena polymorpha]|uniref:Uncharacterized protein n=1 Tax=Dreissena polymorpha TaxID=45954 RepID=A0A9D4LB91_DREPO|nr:hypothetical protein DPMN_097994 [Dreissena polymorpha]